MSADLLREAAALMRERAETVGGWYSPEAWATTAPFNLPIEKADAEHIATFGHPAVALAVAEWLDGVALFVEAKDNEEYFGLDGDPIAPEDTHAIGSALAVARAYLGDES